MMSGIWYQWTEAFDSRFYSIPTPIGYTVCVYMFDAWMLMYGFLTGLSLSSFLSASADTEAQGERVWARDGAVGAGEDRNATAAGRAQERAEPVDGRAGDRPRPPPDCAAGGRPGIHLHRLRWEEPHSPPSTATDLAVTAAIATSQQCYKPLLTETISYVTHAIDVNLKVWRQ